MKRERSCEGIPRAERDRAMTIALKDLEKLSDLYRNGAISKEEYKDMKVKVLNGIKGE